MTKRNAGASAAGGEEQMRERTDRTNTWELKSVIYRYPGASRPAVDALSVRIGNGRATAVLGPNGSGKSTLLKLLLGIIEPASGSVQFGDRELGSWTRRDLARTIGVVPQDEDISFPITVREMVSMGRYPHLGPMRAEGVEDRTAIEEAMERCDVAAFSPRMIQSLSGGERQRVRLARALAQRPQVLVLDEPTRALDMKHEMEILELIRSFVAGGGTAVVVTHNINLAARYADEILLMSEGRVAAFGTPVDVLTGDRVQEVYGWPVTLTAHPGPGADSGAVQIAPLAARSGS